MNTQIEKLILDPEIAWIKHAHLTEICSIEEENHAQADEDFGIETKDFLCWDEETFREKLQEENIVGTVALVGEHVAGFTYYQILDTKVVILKFEIARKFDNDTDVGEKMFRVMLSKLGKTRHSDRTLSRRLEVVEPENRLNKHLFWKSCKPVSTKVLKKFFQNSENREQDLDGYKFVFEKPN